MLPLSDGLPARRFPVARILLIAANFAVFILYELPNLNSAVYHASFYPCTADNACRGPEPWGVSWITAMFLHGGWVEDAFGPLLYLGFYFAGGFAAMMLQTAMTLLFGTAAEARVPELGASGAIAAVLGAYFLLYPGSRIRTWIFRSSWSGSRPGFSSESGSCTSSSRRASGCSAPRRTGAASRSSRTSAGSSSAWW